MSPRWLTIEKLVFEPDDVVREAWMAIAVTQDRMAGLSQVMARARAVRDRAQALQDDSLRLRRRRPSDKP